MEAGGRREVIQFPSRFLGGKPRIPYGIVMKKVLAGGGGIVTEATAQPQPHFRFGRVKGKASPGVEDSAVLIGVTVSSTSNRCR